MKDVCIQWPLFDDGEEKKTVAKTYKIFSDSYYTFDLYTISYE